ncbi:MAG: hypothetical protein IT303_00715 [Dehalococcoidia bacterium]|nr:hypothetical protein [Dehalococcoidia bacterium]
MAGTEDIGESIVGRGPNHYYAPVEHHARPIDIVILTSLADGRSIDEILADYRVTHDDVRRAARVAAIALASDSSPAVRPGVPWATVPGYIEEARRLYPRAYEPWTPADEERIVGLFNAGTPIVEIAGHLGRNPGAIESRLKRIGRRAQGPS